MRWFIDSVNTLSFWVLLWQNPQKSLWFYILIESSIRNLSRFFWHNKTQKEVSKLPYQTLSLERVSSSPKNQVQINRGIVCCNGQDFHLKWKRILSFFILLNKILHRYEHAHYCYILCCSKVQVSRHLLQKSGALRTLGLRTDSNAQSIC